MGAAVQLRPLSGLNSSVLPDTMSKLLDLIEKIIASIPFSLSNIQWQLIWLLIDAVDFETVEEMSKQTLVVDADGNVAIPTFPIDIPGGVPRDSVPADQMKELLSKAIGWLAGSNTGSNQATNVIKGLALIAKPLLAFVKSTPVWPFLQPFATLLDTITSAADSVQAIGSSIMAMFQTAAKAVGAGAATLAEFFKLAFLRRHTRTAQGFIANMTNDLESLVSSAMEVKEQSVTDAKERTTPLVTIWKNRFNVSVLLMVPVIHRMLDKIGLINQTVANATQVVDNAERLQQTLGVAKQVHKVCEWDVDGSRVISELEDTGRSTSEELLSLPLRTDTTFVAMSQLRDAVASLTPACFRSVLCSQRLLELVRTLDQHLPEVSSALGLAARMSKRVQAWAAVAEPLERLLARHRSSILSLAVLVRPVWQVTQCKGHALDLQGQLVRAECEREALAGGVACVTSPRTPHCTLARSVGDQVFDFLHYASAIETSAMEELGIERSNLTTMVNETNWQAADQVKQFVSPFLRTTKVVFDMVEQVYQQSLEGQALIAVLRFELPAEAMIENAFLPLSLVEREYRAVYVRSLPKDILILPQWLTQLHQSLLAAIVTVPECADKIYNPLEFAARLMPAFRNIQSLVQTFQDAAAAMRSTASAQSLSAQIEASSELGAMPGTMLTSFSRLFCFFRQTLTSVRYGITWLVDKIYDYLEILAIGTWASSRPPECTTAHCLEVAEQSTALYRGFFFPMRFMHFWQLSQPAIKSVCGGHLTQRYTVPGLLSGHALQSATFWKVEIVCPVGVTLAKATPFTPAICAGLACPKFEHILAFGPTKDGRCLSGPLSCLSVNARLGFTDSKGKLDAVLEVLKPNSRPYGGSLTGLASSTEMRKIWACGRESPTKPWMLHTFDLVMTRLAVVAYDVLGLSFITMKNSTALNYEELDLDGHRCLLTWEPDYDQKNGRDIPYQGRLWITVVNKDAKAHATKSIKAVGLLQRNQEGSNDVLGNIISQFERSRRRELKAFSFADKAAEMAENHVARRDVQPSSFAAEGVDAAQGYRAGRRVLERPRVMHPDITQPSHRHTILRRELQTASQNSQGATQAGASGAEIIPAEGNSSACPAKICTHMACCGHVTALILPNDNPGFRKDFYELDRGRSARGCTSSSTRVYSSCPQASGTGSASSPSSSSPSSTPACYDEHVISFDFELNAWTMTKVGSSKFIWRSNDVARGNVTGKVACPERQTWYAAMFASGGAPGAGAVKGALTCQGVPEVGSIPTDKADRRRLQSTGGTSTGAQSTHACNMVTNAHKLVIENLTQSEQTSESWLTQGRLHKLTPHLVRLTTDLSSGLPLRSIYVPDPAAPYALEYHTAGLELLRTDALQLRKMICNEPWRWQCQECTTDKQPMQAAVQECVQTIDSQKCQQDEAYFGGMVRCNETTVPNGYALRYDGDLVEGKDKEHQLFGVFLSKSRNQTDKGGGLQPMSLRVSARYVPWIGTIKFDAQIDLKPSTKGADVGGAKYWPAKEVQISCDSSSAKDVNAQCGGLCEEDQEEWSATSGRAQRDKWCCSKAMQCLDKPSAANSPYQACYPPPPPPLPPPKRDEAIMDMGTDLVSAFSFYRNVFDERCVAVSRCNVFGKNNGPCKLEFHLLQKFAKESDMDITLTVEEKKGRRLATSQETGSGRRLAPSLSRMAGSRGRRLRRNRKKRKPKVHSNKRKDKGTEERKFTNIGAVRVPTGLGALAWDSAVNNNPQRYFTAAFIGTTQEYKDSTAAGWGDPEDRLFVIKCPILETKWVKPFDRVHAIKDGAMILDMQLIDTEGGGGKDKKKKKKGGSGGGKKKKGRALADDHAWDNDASLALQEGTQQLTSPPRRRLAAQKVCLPVGPIRLWTEHYPLGSYVVRAMIYPGLFVTGEIAANWIIELDLVGDVCMYPHQCPNWILSPPLCASPRLSVP